MARSKAFLRTRDVDWAVKIGKNYIHAASAGGDLPGIVDEHLFEIWRELKNSQQVCEEEDVIINQKYIEEKKAELRELSEEERELRIQWYTCSFKQMACRGFYSFDRDIRTPFDDSKYRLVARPGRMWVRPEYNLPAIDIESDPEELDGMDIVRWIDEKTKREE